MIMIITLCDAIKSGGPFLVFTQISEARVSQLCFSHFLRPSAASCISSCHLSSSLLPQHFLFSFVSHHFSISSGPEGRFLLCVAGEILTRLWCLLIVPLSNWDARRSPFPWWQQQFVPLATASPPQTHQRGGRVGESWEGGLVWRAAGGKKKRKAELVLVLFKSQTHLSVRPSKVETL